ncbi:hypothetical protein Vadar_017779 [Vaccinium darrowii]|uniref:Uncharacterized protein n=1 Tax=Vaccinium darrowii TaxID=229202 RepID=A0ACB7YXB7_9ERIC|nr:hypothetical protein Vadar_017779 [Vaccinium darrowii]
MSEHDVISKFVSKNLLFVANVAPKAIGEIGLLTPEESWLVVYLIDTVTGRILHRVTHHGSQGPVHAVFSENWVVYHYFNLKAHRYEMSFLEIYDQSQADNKDVWKLVLGKHNLTSPISSYSPPELDPFTGFWLLTCVFLILIEQSIPRKLRRKKGLYLLLIHYQSCHRTIVTLPAKLESTTLIFAYGVDLFFTRMAPSKTYDSLTEDFSYALLLLAIVALLVAIVATWVLSERKELQDQWK